jgi:DNA-binding response OmpR family regulator
MESPPCRVVVGRVTEDQRGASRAEQLLFGDLRINQVSREVFVGPRLVKLTRKEFDLLCVLAQNAGRALTRLELVQAVWGNAFEGSDTTVTVHIRRLRLKIESDPRTPRHIETIWNVGYRFQAEEAPNASGRDSSVQSRIERHSCGPAVTARLDRHV